MHERNYRTIKVKNPSDLHVVTLTGSPFLGIIVVYGSVVISSGGCSPESPPGGGITSVMILGTK